MNDVVLVSDFRVRVSGGGLLVGDRVPLRNGGDGVVYRKAYAAGGEQLLVVPVELVSEEWWAAVYRGEYQTDEDFVGVYGPSPGERVFWSGVS